MCISPSFDVSFNFSARGSMHSISFTPLHLIDWQQDVTWTSREMVAFSYCKTSRLY